MDHLGAPPPHPGRATDAKDGSVVEAAPFAISHHDKGRTDAQTATAGAVTVPVPGKEGRTRTDAAMTSMKSCVNRTRQVDAFEPVRLEGKVDRRCHAAASM